MKSLVTFLIICLSGVLLAELEEPEIGISEKLGEKVSLNLKFTDSEGNTRRLSEIIDKPTVLSLVYYDCPGICSPLLDGMQEVIDRVELKPGDEFRALTISFDPSETAVDAKKFKKRYMKLMKRPFNDEAWSFMVGDSANISELTRAAGFKYQKAGEGDFTHAGALIVLSPDGMISRYLFGLEFNKFDLKMALIEAQKGVFSPTINKMIQFCFSYDPEGGQYVFNVTRVAATALLLGIGIFFTILVVKGKKQKSKRSE